MTEPADVAALGDLGRALERRAAEVARDSVIAGMRRGVQEAMQQAMPEVMALLGTALSSALSGTGAAAPSAGSTPAHGAPPSADAEPARGAATPPPSKLRRAAGKPTQAAPKPTPARPWTLPEPRQGPLPLPDKEAERLMKADGHRRGEAEILALEAVVLQVVSLNPGLKAEELAPRIHPELKAADLRDILLRMTQYEPALLRHKGRKRGKRYYPVDMKPRKPTTATGAAAQRKAKPGRRVGKAAGKAAAART